MLSFLGFVSLGLLHGLVLLPVLLYWTAPAMTEVNKELEEDGKAALAQADLSESKLPVISHVTSQPARELPIKTFQC